MAQTGSKLTALVTGGAGFIGSHVAKKLVQLGEYEVVCLDDLSGGNRENVPEGTSFVDASVTDRTTIDQLFEQYRFDYVYHLAAYAAEGLSHFIRNFNYTNNVVGSMNVINGAIRHHTKCLVFTSSIAVYGAGQVPMREDTVPQPEDPYGVAKYAVELDLRAAAEMFGLKYVVFRPHNVYGEGQNVGDPYRNVVGIFMNSIMQGKPMTIFGDGEQRRAFTYVGDIAPPIVAAARMERAWGRVFNIGADTPVSVNDLAATVARVMGVPDHPVVHVEERKEVREAYSDHTLGREIFGDLPETPLEEGLARMAAWVRRVGARQSKPFEGIEVRRGLPRVWQNLG